MYGMIHRGIREMVIEQSGLEAWRKMETRLGTGPEHLISAQTYDDSVTSAMIGMAAESRGQSVHECLADFGRYWIRFAARGSYGAMMDFTGNDIITFVENLDRMHQAVRAAMPEAAVPSFKVTGRGAGSLTVEYWSEREGLESFVVGLFEGLLERFGLTGTVNTLETKSNIPQFVVQFTTA